MLKSDKNSKKLIFRLKNDMKIVIFEQLKKTSNEY